MTAEGGWRRGCVRLPFALVGGWLVRRTAEGCFETTAEGCVCVCVCVTRWVAGGGETGGELSVAMGVGGVASTGGW